MRKCEVNMNRLLLTEVPGHLYTPRTYEHVTVCLVFEQIRHRVPRIFGTTAATSVFLSRVRFRDPFIIL